MLAAPPPGYVRHVVAPVAAFIVVKTLTPVLSGCINQRLPPAYAGTSKGLAASAHVGRRQETAPVAASNATTWFPTLAYPIPFTTIGSDAGARVEIR
jgi:hypothetical protein